MDVSWSGLALAELCAQALVEEAAEEQHRADGDERECARHRAQPSEVVGEELDEAEPEEGEAGEPERARGAPEAHVEQCQPEYPPHRADGRMPGLEVSADSARPDQLGELEHGERDSVEPDDPDRPERPLAEPLGPL